MPRKRDPSKQTSQRSHHGCQRCRLHKIRCDEVKPRCGHCSSRGHSDCTYSLVLKWEADYKHVGRAFGRVGVWSKHDLSSNVGQHANSPAFPAAELTLRRRPVPIHSSAFVNLYLRDFQNVDEDENENCKSIASSYRTLTFDGMGATSQVDALGQWPMTRSLTDPLANNLQLVDPHLLSYYLHRVCALTVPLANYATESPFSALLFPFSLSCSSTAIVEALLGLAASHWSRFDKTYRRVAQAYYRKTLGSLRTLLATKTAAESAVDPEILALMMLLCQHELIKDGESRWVVHLRGARDLISFRRQQQQQLPNDAKALTRQRPHPWEQITVFAERFFAFYDVMGRTACGEEPMFGNDFWSTQEDQVDPWMGCSPRLVSIISTITELSWKHHRQIQSRDERQELAKQRDKLQISLQQLSFDSFVSSDSMEADTMRRCVLLKRLTVDLYLHSALADTTPLTPVIKTTVHRILRLIFDLQQLGIRAGLTWPLFMAACQLDPAEDMELEWVADEAGCNDIPQFARPFILHALDQLSDSLANVSRTREVIEKVWRSREVASLMSPSAQAAEEKVAFNDWARFVAPLCHNVSVV